MMLELLRLSGSEERGIVLETRRRSRVANSQAAEPDEHAIGVFGHLLTTHPNWKLRKQACGIYNCFGHVWAARRTAIYDQPDVETILQDDGYRKLIRPETPMLGDVALYYDTRSRNLLHAGLVCELQSVLSLTQEKIGIPAPWIQSKLNDVSGEVLHHYRDVHYEDFQLEYWTDRPLQGTP